MSFAVKPIPFALGQSQTGLTLEARPFDAARASAGSAITTTFTEIGGGNYAWRSTAVPDATDTVDVYTTGGTYKTTLKLDASDRLPPSRFFGDSNTAGYGLVDVTTRFSTLLSVRRKWEEINGGINSAQLADMADTVLAWAIDGQSRTTGYVGTNDVRAKGTNAGWLAQFSTALDALIAHCAIPDAHKVKHDDPRVTYTGTFATANVNGGLRYTSTPGDTVSIPLGKGTIVVAWVTQLAGNGSTARWAAGVNGVAKGTISSLMAANTNSAIGYQPALLIVPGLEYEDQTLLLTAQNAGNQYFGGAAVLDGRPLGPKVILSGCARMAAYNSLDEWGNGSDAAADLYAATARGRAEYFRDTLGQNVQYVPPRIRPASDLQVDTIHFATTGHSRSDLSLDAGHAMADAWGPAQAAGAVVTTPFRDLAMAGKVALGASLGAGTGDTAVNHDTGGADNLRLVLGAGGLDDAEVRAYLKSDYDAGNVGDAYVQGQTFTGPVGGVSGRIPNPMYLNAGTTYTIVWSKQGVITALTKEFTI